MRMKPCNRSASETCTLDSSSEPPERSSFTAGRFCIRQRSGRRNARGLQKSGSRGGLRFLLFAVHWPPDCQLGSRRSRSHPSRHRLLPAGAVAGRDSLPWKAPTFHGAHSQEPFDLLYNGLRRAQGRQGLSLHTRAHLRPASGPSQDTFVPSRGSTLSTADLGFTLPPIQTTLNPILPSTLPPASLR